MLIRITQALWSGYSAREWEHLRQSGTREASALNAPRQEIARHIRSVAWHANRLPKIRTVYIQFIG
jgi:hypothetical protein